MVVEWIFRAEDVMSQNTGAGGGVGERQRGWAADFDPCDVISQESLVVQDTALDGHLVSSIGALLLLF